MVEKRKVAKDSISQILDSFEEDINHEEIGSGPATARELRVLAQVFAKNIYKHTGRKMIDTSEELAEIYIKSRAFRKNRRNFLLSALGYKLSERDFPTEEDVRHLELSLEIVRGENYKPIITRLEAMMADAERVAEMIEDWGRQSMDFNKLIRRFNLDKDEEFKPDCELIYMNTDTDSHSKQSGALSKNLMLDVIETKKHCVECPLKIHCLASSLASPQNTRMSKKERTIPTHDGSLLTMSEYGIFGGYTPQERRIIFNRVCDILEENDRR